MIVILYQRWIDPADWSRLVRTTDENVELMNAACRLANVVDQSKAVKQRDELDRVRTDGVEV